MVFLMVTGYFTFITFLSCFLWNASNCSSSSFVGLQIPELYRSIGLMIDLYNLSLKTCLILSFLIHILFVLFGAAVTSCFLRLISSVAPSQDSNFIVVCQFSVLSFLMINFKSSVILDLFLFFYYGFFCFQFNFKVFFL